MLRLLVVERGADHVLEVVVAGAGAQRVAEGHFRRSEQAHLGRFANLICRLNNLPPNITNW